MSTTASPILSRVAGRGSSGGLGPLNIGSLGVQKQEYLRNLEEIGQQVGLPDWTSSPALLSKEQEERFPQARTEALGISVFDNYEVRCKAFELLQRLFEHDPITVETASGFEKALKDLSDLVAKAEDYTVPEQKFLIKAYASAIEAFLAHIGQKHIGRVSAATKEAFSTAPILLKKLNKGGTDSELKLDIEYAIEGVKRVASDEKQTDLLDCVFQVTKIVAYAAMKDVAKVWEEATKLFSDAKTKVESRQKSWYETICFIRGLSRLVVYSSDRGMQALDRLSGLIFDQTLSKDYDRRVFTSAVRAWEYIILHHKGENSLAIYQHVLGSDPEKLAFPTILSHKKVRKNSYYDEVETSVVSVINKLSEKVFNPEIEAIFQQAMISILLSIKNEDLRKSMETSLKERINRHTTWALTQVEEKEKKLQATEIRLIEKDKEVKAYLAENHEMRTELEVLRKKISQLKRTGGGSNEEDRELIGLRQGSRVNSSFEEDVFFSKQDKTPPEKGILLHKSASATNSCGLSPNSKGGRSSDPYFIQSGQESPRLRREDRFKSQSAENLTRRQLPPTPTKLGPDDSRENYSPEDKSGQMRGRRIGSLGSVYSTHQLNSPSLISTKQRHGSASPLEEGVALQDRLLALATIHSEPSSKRTSVNQDAHQIPDSVAPGPALRVRPGKEQDTKDRPSENE